MSPHSNLPFVPNVGEQVEVNGMRIEVTKVSFETEGTKVSGIVHQPEGRYYVMNVPLNHCWPIDQNKENERSLPEEDADVEDPGY